MPPKQRYFLDLTLSHRTCFIDKRMLGWFMASFIRTYIKLICRWMRLCCAAVLLNAVVKGARVNIVRFIPNWSEPNTILFTWLAVSSMPFTNFTVISFAWKSNIEKANEILNFLHNFRWRRRFHFSTSAFKCFKYLDSIWLSPVHSTATKV